MFYIVVMCAAILAVYALAFALKTYRFRQLCRGGPTHPGSAPIDGTVAIVLPVRGGGPHLPRLLDELLEQDYPDYEIHVVVDSEQDPAWGIAQAALEAAPSGRMQVTALIERRTTCSLKNSALLQALGSFGPHVVALAIIDADVVPTRSWLKELIAPLARHDIGTTFGIPAFVGAGHLEAATRAAWWGFAGGSMALRGWPWGGSTAMTIDTVHASGLSDFWASSLSSDTVVPAALEQVGLRGMWVPGLFMPQRGEGGLAPFLHQVTRYLLVRRLYLPGWTGARWLGTPLFLVLPWAPWLGLVALLMRDATSAILLWAAALSYVAVAAFCLRSVDDAARDALQDRSVDLPKGSRAGPARWFVAVLLAHGLFLFGSMRADRLTRVRWRGATYAVSPEGAIALEDHRSPPTGIV